MTVENLSTDGQFTHSQGRKMRRAAIAKRQAIDRDETKQRHTMEKDSFMAFGHVADTLDQQGAIDATIREEMAKDFHTD